MTTTQQPAALTIASPIGTLTALPTQAQRIAAMTDAEFCAELNRRPCDPFVFGAWLKGARNDVIAFNGWSTFTLRAKGSQL